MSGKRLYLWRNQKISEAKICDVCQETFRQSQFVNICTIELISEAPSVEPACMDVCIECLKEPVVLHNGSLGDRILSSLEEFTKEDAKFTRIPDDSRTCRFCGTADCKQVPVDMSLLTGQEEFDRGLYLCNKCIVHQRLQIVADTDKGQFKLVVIWDE